MKIEVTIRCNRCDAIESVVTEAWAGLQTTCGCEGPYRIIDRKPLPEPEEPEASGNNKGAPAASGSDKSETAPAATDESPKSEN